MDRSFAHFNCVGLFKLHKTSNIFINFFVFVIGINFLNHNLGKSKINNHLYSYQLINLVII